MKRRPGHEAVSGPAPSDIGDAAMPSSQAAAAMPVPAMSSGLATPLLRPCIDLWVEVGVPVGVGQTVGGERRVVPITGGRAVGLSAEGAGGGPAGAAAERGTPGKPGNGAGWQARILEGGADYQLITASGCALLHARYILETDGGDRIYVENNAIRTGPPELVARLLRGEPVDPAAIYFRCAPRIEAAAASLRWMNERVFVGTGARHPSQVVLRFFVVE